MLRVSVQEINGKNAYVFRDPNTQEKWRGDKILKLKKGLYAFLDIPQDHPIAFINGKGLAQNAVTPGSLVFAGESGKYVEREVDGITYRFWWGALGVMVDERFDVNGEIDFGTLSYYCAYHGYMGGENSVQYDADC
jgi:hypothetical protein